MRQNRQRALQALERQTSTVRRMLRREPRTIGRIIQREQIGPSFRIVQRRGSLSLRPPFASGLKPDRSGPLAQKKELNSFTNTLDEHELPSVEALSEV